VVFQQCTGYGDEVAAKQLCFIAFLPDILDSKASGRNAYIKTMKKVAEKFKDRPFSWLWSSAGQQAALEVRLSFMLLKFLDRTCLDLTCICIYASLVLVSDSSTRKLLPFAYSCSPHE
jgi:hypothetical protein